MSRKHSRKRGNSRNRPRPRWRRVLLVALVLSLVATLAYGAWLDHNVRSQFEGKRWSIPATVYARPLELYAGRALTPDQLLTELAAAGYREIPAADRPGSWSRNGNAVRLTTRAFDHWDGHEPSVSLEVRFGDGHIQSLQRPGSAHAPSLARVDPAQIGAIAPTRREDRLLVQLDDVPVTLIGGLLAVEDRQFHRHHGLSPSGIARAAVANIRAGRIVQGGSTLTQQLVKNFYLTGEQTLSRKLNEAIMAVLLELRYDKRDILETYLNEVFLAQDADRAIHGFGLAAPYFFGEPLPDLPVEHQALLIAMVKGPSYYNPHRHPQRARERRNLVLRVMAESGVLGEDEARAAQEQPLGLISRHSAPRHNYPAFMDLVQRHLQRDYRREDLQTEGLRVFSTLSPLAQSAAEQAAKARLAGQSDALELGVVTLEVDSGEVTALIGGRDAQFAGFNRALDAKRPVGSLIKPAVYLAALERPARWGLGSLLDDSPIELEDEQGKVWSPRNFDETHRGDVLLVDALAHSHNVPTVRLGMDVGVTAVTDVVRRLGQVAPRRAYPSYLLGTAELSPLEVAQMYQVFAAEGFRVPLRSVRAVSDGQGAPLKRYRLATERVVAPESVYLLNYALQRAMREGTGSIAYSVLPRSLALAGKTGTTNDYRDSWFAGYSGDTLGVVWLGRDDYGTIGLTGATGALGVWAETLAQLSARGFNPARPQDVERVWIDRDTGKRSHDRCDGAVELPYVVGHEPERWTECGRREHERGDESDGSWLRRWFQ